MMWQALVGSLFLLAVDGESSAPRMFGQEVVEVEPLTAAEVEQRRASFQRMLDDRGWVQIGDQVGPSDGKGGFAQPNDPVRAWDTPPHRSTIFLNFFGAEMTNGTNAALNESSCIDSTTMWPGFAGTEAQALALIDVFEQQMEPYGVRIAYEEIPPPELPYAMVMMGGSPEMLGLGGSVLGVSCSSDCGDFWWRDTTFAFTDAINPDNAAVLGTTALHEAAHAFGLAHIGDPTKIMNPFVGSADVTWGDECIPYDDATGGINCQPTHDEFCDGGAQNSHAELLAYFGPNSPDMEPPTVTITNPPDDIELEVGGSLTIEAEITDNHEGVGWKIVIPEIDVEEPAFAFQKQWQLGDLPQGVYTVRVEAVDHDRNVASDEVTLYIGVEAGDESSGGGSSSSGADSSGSSTSPVGESGGETGDEDDDEPIPAEDDGDKGCGCTTVRPAPMLLLAPFLLAFAHRRRKPTTPRSTSA